MKKEVLMILLIILLSNFVCAARCGNGKVEEGEECDPGIVEKNITQCGEISALNVNWERNLTFDKFDSSLGELVRVEKSLESEMTSNFYFEHLGASLGYFDAKIKGKTVAYFYDSDNTSFYVLVYYSKGENNIPSFDGIIDFAGPSGRTYLNINSSNSSSLTLYSPDIENYTALFLGESFNVKIKASANTTINSTGNMAPVFSTKARAYACLTYYYNFSDKECRENCTIVRCGDGIKDIGEECDDGNLINGDGCDNNCKVKGIEEFCNQFTCGSFCNLADYLGDEPEKENPHDCVTVIVKNGGTYYPKCVPLICQV